MIPFVEMKSSEIPNNIVQKTEVVTAKPARDINNLVTEVLHLEISVDEKNGDLHDTFQNEVKREGEKELVVETNASENVKNVFNKENVKESSLSPITSSPPHNLDTNHQYLLVLFTTEEVSVLFHFLCF